MTAVLLSIKPEFAEKIFNGTKKYEFRKSIFKRSDIHKIIVYVSSPVKKIIGEFSVEDVLCDTVEAIWNKTHQYSGISKQYYQTYYENRDKAYAIKIGNVIRYKCSCNLRDYNISAAPQSFIYIKI